MEIKNIVCIGAGYVGAPTMAIIADNCPHVQVNVVDINPERIARWNSAELPVFEPGLDEIVQRVRGRNLHFSLVDPQAYANADVIFVSVNTPTKTYGQGAGMAPDMRYWELSARDILKHATGETIVVEKSTVPVRTAETIARILNTAQDGRAFHVLSNPEFLAEGTAIRDLTEPDRVLIGGEESPAGEASAQALADLYAHWVPREKILLSNVWTSELAKLAANAFLAQRISSINSISAICEKTQAVVGDVATAIGMDSRIGPRFLEASIGFGGSCFRKDILDLVYICQNYGLTEVAEYWRSVVEINEYQIARFVRQMVDTLFKTVDGKKLAIFGFAFKPDTNDTRDSPAISVCMKLLEERANLAICDPAALDNARLDLQGMEARITFEDDPYAAAQGAHAIALITHWEQFRALDYARIYESMAKPAFIFDGRCWLDAKALHKIGFNVFPIGQEPLVHY